MKSVVVVIVMIIEMRMILIGMMFLIAEFMLNAESTTGFVMQLNPLGMRLP